MFITIQIDLPLWLGPLKGLLTAVKKATFNPFIQERLFSLLKRILFLLISINYDLITSNIMI